jgi:hypothetical protein
VAPSETEFAWFLVPAADTLIRSTPMMSSPLSSQDACTQEIPLVLTAFYTSTYLGAYSAFPVISVGFSFLSFSELSHARIREGFTGSQTQHL